jgi:hypothetical protein
VVARSAFSKSFTRLKGTCWGLQDNNGEQR